MLSHVVSASARLILASTCMKVIGSLVAVVAIVAAAVVIGVVVAKHHKSSSSSSSDSDNGSPTLSDPNDPSNFQKDSQLHKSFFGLAYTPEGSQLPNCGATLGSLLPLSLSLTFSDSTLDAVTVDVQLMSQLTDVDFLSLSLSNVFIEVNVDM